MVNWGRFFYVRIPTSKEPLQFMLYEKKRRELSV